jgi:gas vesicle protein
MRSDIPEKERKSTMRDFNRGNTMQRWARFALKCGILLTDAKLWSSISEQLRDRADDMGDTVKRTYNETTDRVSDAHQALQGRSHWATHTVNFLGGVGLGVGLGILLAPASGQETRSAIRDKVVDFKSRVGDAASTAAYRARRTTAEMSGTGGD